MNRFLICFAASIYLFLLCALSAFEGEFTVVLRLDEKKFTPEQAESAIRALRTLEFMKTESSGDFYYYTMKGRAPILEIQKEFNSSFPSDAEKNTLRAMLLEGHASLFRFMTKKKVSPEDAAEIFRDKNTKIPPLFAIEGKMKLSSWTGADYARFLKLILELPESAENAKPIRRFLLLADARGQLPELEKIASPRVAEVLLKYRSGGDWEVVATVEKEGKIVFLKPSTGEHQEFPAPSIPFFDFEKAERGGDFLRFPYGNSFFEFRLVSGRWTLTRDPVKNPPADLNFGENKSDLSSLAPGGQKLFFVQKAIHPFLAEYEYELRSPHPGGPEKVLPLQINTGGATFINLYKVPPDPEGRYGELLIFETNYGTDIFDWKDEKVFMLARIHKRDCAVPGESPLFRKLYLQERRSGDQFPNLSFDDGQGKSYQGDPPARNVSDWKILSRRVYAGHIGRDGRFQTAGECPYKAPKYDYSLDEIDPEKLAIPTLQSTWNALMNEESMIFFRTGNFADPCIEGSFTEIPAWCVFQRFPRRERLNFLAGKLSSSAPSCARMLKKGSLSEGAFALAVLHASGGFERLFAVSRTPEDLYSHPENFPQHAFSAKRYDSLKAFLDENEIVCTSFPREGTLDPSQGQPLRFFCNFPGYAREKKIRFRMTSYRSDKDGKMCKDKECSVLICKGGQFQRNSASNPDGIDFSFRFVRENGNCFFRFQVFDCQSVQGEAVFPAPSGNASWSFPFLDADGVRRGKEFLLMDFSAQKGERLEIRGMVTAEE